MPGRDWPVLWWRHLTLCLWLPVLSPFARSPFCTLSIDIQFKLTALRRVLYDRCVMEKHAEGITVKISPNYKDIFHSCGSEEDPSDVLPLCSAGGKCCTCALAALPLLHGGKKGLEV